jgi:hypothetical protein
VCVLYQLYKEIAAMGDPFPSLIALGLLFLVVRGQLGQSVLVSQ